MKTLVLLSLSLAVALAGPASPPGVAQNTDFIKDDQSPLLGDWVPLQGHVELEDPAPQARLGSKEPQEKLPPVPADMEQSQIQNMVELEVKARPHVKVEQEGEVKTEVKMEPELNAEPGVRVEQESMVELEIKVRPDVKAEPEVKPEPQVKVDPKPEVHLNADVMAELQVNMKAEMEPELKADQDFKVESEVKAKPEPEEDPMFNEVQEKFQVQMKLEAETETGTTESEEKHIDMEGNYEMVGEPIMKLEPQDDDNMFGEEASDTEQSGVEKSLRVGFQSPVAEPQPEEEGLMRKNDHVLDEEPIMELEPEMEKEPFQNEEVIPDGPAMEEGPAQIGVEVNGGQRYCPGVEFEDKCYQFFKGPMRAADAEFFCQRQFPLGHLASITSQHIHRKVMNMMLEQNGAYTRTWIGGLRYLETGLFIWLDGSHWGYADWLSGEPNDTAGVEDCLELLAFGNGKFNDFTCWEPQSFICSYPYQ